MIDAAGAPVVTPVVKFPQWKPAHTLPSGQIRDFSVQIRALFDDMFPHTPMT